MCGLGIGCLCKRSNNIVAWCVSTSHSHSHLACFQKVRLLKKRGRQNTVEHTEIFKLGTGSDKIVKAMKTSGFKICVYPFIKVKESSKLQKGLVG
jgi:hypothetical protein